MSRFTSHRIIPIVFWLFAVIAVIAWSLVPGYVVGWDLHVYQNAIISLRAGHDPYADGIAVQQAFHNGSAQHPNVSLPWSYVYSPITLPLLHFISLFSFHISGGIYWLLYLAAVLVVLWTCMQAVEAKEGRIFALLAPAAVFFPGLLQNDALFSGNIAYILYGFTFATASIGWQSGRWKWFYLGVLAASCCKAPMLYLLAIPVLSARRQWLWAGMTGLAGTAIFAIQPYVWPDLFHHYLQAVELQFSFNRDFSSSPAGLLADALYNVIPYQVTSVGSYFFYATLVFGTLVYLSRKFFTSHFSQKQWIPVLLVGVFLLNPRIMEYDVAPITLPMALIAWRVLSRLWTRTYTLLAMSLFFLLFNSVGEIIPRGWKPTECALLIGLFVVGSWNLIQQMREDQDESYPYLGASLSFDQRANDFHP